MLQLTDEVAPLHNGDLRVRASTNDTLTDGLANTLNHSVSEMRWLASSLDSSAQAVQHCVDDARQVSERIKQTSLEQSEYVHQSSNYLLSMSVAMAELSASKSSTSAPPSPASSDMHKGRHTLLACLENLTPARSELDTCNEKVNRVSVNVRDIDERISVISELAERLDLIALNSTIKGSVSAGSSNDQKVGESGEELNKISEEVCQLVEALATSSKDVTAISQAISHDSDKAIASLQSICKAIDVSLQQVSSTAELLHDSYASSSDPEARSSEFSDSTIAHVSTVSKLTEQMDLIHQLAQRTSNDVVWNDELLQELESMASELRQELGGYKLPERASSTGTRPSPSAARRAADRAALHG